MTILRRSTSHIIARPTLPHCRRIVPGVENIPEYMLTYNYTIQRRTYPSQSYVRYLFAPVGSASSKLNTEREHTQEYGCEPSNILTNWTFIFDGGTSWILVLFIKTNVIREDDIGDYLGVVAALVLLNRHRQPGRKGQSGKDVGSDLGRAGGLTAS